MEVVVYLFNLYLLLLPLPSYVYLRDVYLRDVYLRDVYLRESYYSISTALTIFLMWRGPAAAAEDWKF